MKDFNQNLPELDVRALRLGYGMSLDYYVSFASSPNHVEAMYVYPCTGKVYTYNFSDVYTGTIRYPHNVSTRLGDEWRWACDDAYSVFAGHVGEGYAFGVHNAGRTGTAELELLACLAPQRHAQLLHKVSAAYDTVLQLQYHAYKEVISWAMPHACSTHNCEGYYAFAVLYALRKHGVTFPDCKYVQDMMPYAGRVVSETLRGAMDRADVIAGLKRARKFFESPGHCTDVESFLEDMKVLADKYQHLAGGVFTIEYPRYHTDTGVITEAELA